MPESVIKIYNNIVELSRTRLSNLPEVLYVGVSLPCRVVYPFFFASESSKRRKVFS